MSAPIEIVCGNSGPLSQLVDLDYASGDDSDVEIVEPPHKKVCIEDPDATESEDEKGDEGKHDAIVDAKEEKKQVCADAFNNWDKKQEGFQFHGKSGMFTWVNVPEELKCADLEKWLVEKFVGVLHHYTIGREICPSTKTVHFHAFIEFKTKKRIKNCGVTLAWGGSPPNVQPSQKAVRKPDAGRDYASKGGECIVSGLRMRYDTCTNFKRRLEDFNCYTSTIAANSVRPLLIGDLIFPNGVRVESLLRGRRRNLWITGLPGLGKTTWINKEIERTNKRVFCKAGHAQYPYDGYKQERIILIDDRVSELKPDELKMAGNTGENRPVPFGTRYNVTMNHVDGWNMVVLANNDDYPGSYVGAAWFDQRFLMCDFSDDCVACPATSDCVHKRACEVCVLDLNNDKWPEVRRIARCKCNCFC